MCSRRTLRGRQIEEIHPVQIWMLRNAIFRTYHEIFLQKIDFEFANGKQLQVNIIKITETRNSQVPEENETPAEVQNIFQAAKQVFASVAANTGFQQSTSCQQNKVDKTNKSRYHQHQCSY